MAITTGTTTVITMVKIIWFIFFLNIFPNDQSNAEPTTYNITVSVLSNTISAILIPTI
jgi:hypothetical protein